MQNKAIETFYLFFEGIMLFQVAFFGMIYIISRRKDVLYYSLLNLVSGIYFFLNAPDTFLGIDEDIIFNSPNYLYANFAIFLSMIFMYLVFLKEIFNDTLEQYNYVKNVYTITFYFIPLLYMLFVLFAFLGWQTNIIFYTGHLVNAPFCTLILILNFRQKGYKKLIIYGMLVVFICVNVTIFLTVRYNAGSNATLFDKYPLLIIKLGMLIDILFFQLALLKRWNEQEKQLVIEKLQSQLAVEKLRNKIGSQLHDDIGSTISGVSMYSYMADMQLQNGEHEKVTKTLKTIQQNAKEVVNKLSDLVWAVNPVHDSVDMMLEKIQQYGIEICKTKNIEFNLSRHSMSDTKLTEEERYHIYSCMKEAINNAVKYSNASLLQLDVKQRDDNIEISLQDNGIGFDANTIKRGNGLNNMEQRVREIGGEINMLSSPGNGCLISIKANKASLKNNP